MTHILLKKVRSYQQFWLADGKGLKNLEELAFALQEMDETTFHRHVNEHKNDFHSWVREVHQDKKLANALLHVKKKEHAFQAVQGRITELVGTTNSQKQKRKNARRVVSLPDEESYRGVFSQVPWYQNTITLVTLFGVLLMVAFVTALSSVEITGAVVEGSARRGTMLLGVTLLVTGIFFILAARKSHTKK